MLLTGGIWEAALFASDALRHREVSMIAEKGMERITKALAVLALGWFIGYMHHYMATRTVWERLGLQISELGAEIAELRQILGPLKQARKVSLKVTAYSNDAGSIDVPLWRDGMTATGSRAASGTVSADWEVLRPGSRLYVPGYGFGTVEDRGGGVRGGHIDVFMETREDALQWGVKSLRVFVF